jgi:pilus assembly protein Flp/PilA
VTVTKHVLTFQLFIAARRARFEEEGATAVEYSLMVGMLAFAIITGVSFFGSRVAREYNVISNTIPTGLG